MHQGFTNNATAVQILYTEDDMEWTQPSEYDAKQGSLQFMTRREPDAPLIEAECNSVLPIQCPRFAPNRSHPTISVQMQHENRSDSGN